MQSRTVEVAEWARRAVRTQSVGRVRRLAVGAVGVGAFLVVLAVAGCVTFLATWSQPGMLFGVAFLAVMGSFMIWSGLIRLRVNRGRSAEQRVTFAAPHAFRITGDTLEFPGTVMQVSESWPRTVTTATVESTLGRSTLTLRHPGRRTRRYLAKGLRESPEQVLAALDQP